MVVRLLHPDTNKYVCNDRTNQVLQLAHEYKNYEFQWVSELIKNVKRMKEKFTFLVLDD